MDQNSQNKTSDDQDLDKILDDAAQLTKEKIQNDPILSQSLAGTPQMQNIVVDVEEELLKEIITRLEKGSLTVDNAQKLAKEFLSLLPVKDRKDLLEKLHALSGENTDARGIYLKYAVPMEEQERHRKLDLMSQHLHGGNIEQAIAVAKGGQNG